MEPKKIRELVEIAFVLEPLLDKKDCSTRYIDLPGKPIYDFIISGINVGEIFQQYAADHQINPSQGIFSHFIQALNISNKFKAKKTVNVGLLEFMFLAVRARLLSNSIGECLDKLAGIAHTSTNADVNDLYNAYQVALQTSVNEAKKNEWQTLHKNFLDSPSLQVFFERLREAKPDGNSAHNQIANQYLNGFPIIRQMVEGVDESKGLIKSIEDTYNQIHAKSPEIKIGILADFSAAAMFIYLSFQDSGQYSIR